MMFWQRARSASRRFFSTCENEWNIVVIALRTTRFLSCQLSQVDKHITFRGTLRSKWGRDTGRDTRRAVGSWSHQLFTTNVTKGGVKLRR